MYKEGRESGISLPLIRANLSYVEGDFYENEGGQSAVRLLTEGRVTELQRETSYVTKKTKNLLRLYEKAAQGGWIAYGTTIDGGVGEVPYFKPKRPRSAWKEKNKGFGKVLVEKKVKYETPKGMPGEPLLPCVDSHTAKVIFERYEVLQLPGETFWQTVRRCKEIPVALTEGLKKALCLLTLGVPAIAIRGVTMWHRAGESTPYPVIKAFIGEGREMPIIFDEDRKQKTRRNVDLQAKKLGLALEAEDPTVKVTVPTWDGDEGKGIDDRLVAFRDPRERSSWLTECLQHAPTLREFLARFRADRALDNVISLQKLSLKVTRRTEGGYMPELPELDSGIIEVIKAPMGTGKTTRIREDRVAIAKKRGWLTLILSPLNSLGRQVAADTNLPHIHDFGKKTNELWAAAKSFGGIVMCPDSLHRLPSEFFERPLLLIFDEANQTIGHTVRGDTLGARQVEILEILAKLSKHALADGAIILAEASLPPRAVTFIQTISQPDAEVRVYEHRGTARPWLCHLYRRDVNGFRAALLGVLEQGKKILYVTASRTEGEIVEAAANASGVRRVVRIDGDTNEGGTYNTFFASPDKWLHKNQPQLLILSPSAKSGVSIEGSVEKDNAYFDSVWGYFSTLATDTHLQLLGRYRPPVERHIFCKPFILADGDESLFRPHRIKTRLKANLKGLAKIHGLEVLLSDSSRSKEQICIEDAVLEYLATAKAVSGSQKSAAADSLIYELLSAGHKVSESELRADKATRDLWSELRESLWQKKARELAALDVCGLDEGWAADVRLKTDASREERLKAFKIQMRAEFPGIFFDCPEEVYQTLTKNYGLLRRGVTLHAAIENLSDTLISEGPAVEAILSNAIRCPHRLPKRYLKALLLSQTGIMDLLDLGEWSSEHPVLKAIKEKALHWAKEIFYWLRLTITKTQSPCEIAHKLLKKLGLKAEDKNRCGKRNSKRPRTYQLEEVSELRGRLLEAAKVRLKLVSATRSKRHLDTLQVADTEETGPQPPPLALIRQKSLLPEENEVAKWWQLAAHALASGKQDSIEAARVLLQSEATRYIRGLIAQSFTKEQALLLGLGVVA